jgi:hypothetical protein
MRRLPREARGALGVIGAASRNVTRGATNAVGSTAEPEVYRIDRQQVKADLGRAEGIRMWCLARAPAPM